MSDSLLDSVEDRPKSELIGEYKGALTDSEVFDPSDELSSYSCLHETLPKDRTHSG